MRRMILSTLLMLCMLSVSQAQMPIAGIRIKGPVAPPLNPTKLVVPRDKLVKLEAAGLPPKAAIKWDYSPKLDSYMPKDKTFVLLVGPPGAYVVKLHVVTVDKDGEPTWETTEFAFTIDGGILPDPIDPPGPDPKPPGPKPTPAPIAGDGFRVLIVEDVNNRTTLPVGQQNIIAGERFRNYLKAKCVMGSDGKTEEFRIWDKETDPGDDDKRWVDAMKRPRTELPWIIISNGKTGYEGPMPKTVDDALALVKKYAEPVKVEKGK